MRLGKVINRLGEENFNFQGCLMKIIEYNNTNDLYVKFQDSHKAIVHSAYREFNNGRIQNPYYPNVLGVGIIGNKYNSKTKEYKTWHAMMCRCYDQKHKELHPTYQDVTCCDEWLLYDNFYEWIHSQENFENWLCDTIPELDKDILVKGNKIYSPETCCLVPHIVNRIFINRANDRGDYPIGVTKHRNRFRARCDNPLLNIREHLGIYDTPEEAFYAYKNYKENLIKQVATIEYKKKNITQQCYKAMMNYEVEITD